MRSRAAARTYIYVWGCRVFPDTRDLHSYLRNPIQEDECQADESRNCKLKKASETV